MKSQFKKYHPSGNLKFYNLGILKSLKLRILVKKNILPISLKLNFTPNSLVCKGLSRIFFFDCIDCRRWVSGIRLVDDSLIGGMTSQNCVGLVLSSIFFSLGFRQTRFHSLLGGGNYTIEKRSTISYIISLRAPCLASLLIDLQNTVKNIAQ